MTRKELIRIKKNLPRRYINELTKRTGEEISESLVKSVMNNGRADYYGIVDAAIQWGFEIKKSKRKQVKRIKTL